MSTTVTQPFQAETRQLLELMIHSLYTQKEIFLRELISNASDAIDRLRFEALTDAEVLAGDDAFEIRLEVDKEARTLSVHDNGIGMDRDEIIANIGTIAKSGTRELIEQVKASGSAEQVKDLIGRFGVGFYSAFMVADRVELLTRRAGQKEAYRWESDGRGEYTLGTAAKAGRGTSIMLHLKDVDSEAGIEDYTDPWVLSRIVKRYSDFVTYPIRQRVERQEPERDDEGNIKEGGKNETVIEDQTLNSMKPIWSRPKSEVKDEEYAELYRHISHDWNPPLKTLRFHAEGRIEYDALLFIPSQAPFDLYYYGHEHGLQLYVRQVMIMERCEDLLPQYLRFVRGVVESADLPLNISRQRLQEDRHITQMRKWLSRKVLDSLKEIQKDDEETYLKIWEHFGRALKEGLTAGPEHRDTLLALALFQSSNDPEKLTTLAQYVERMPVAQEAIYYLTGESRQAVAASPHLEAFREKGVEVLYLTDPVDELVVQQVREFDSKPLQDISRGTALLGSAEEREKAEQETKSQAERHKDLLERFAKHLEAEVKEVRLSNRLTTSPACLVGGEDDMTPQMERLLRESQAGPVPKQRRILELNPKHPLFTQLTERYQRDPEDPVAHDYAELLLGYAYLAEGSDLPDRNRFNDLLTEVMVSRLAGGAPAVPRAGDEEE